MTRQNEKMIEELADEIKEMRSDDFNSYEKTITDDMGIEFDDFMKDGTDIESFDDIDNLQWSEGYQKGIRFAIDLINKRGLK